MHYVHKKTRCGSEIATFRTKTLHFFQVIRLNWLANIELRGTRRPWSTILLISYTVVSEKCDKRNWNWRSKMLVRHIFVIGEISVGVMPPPPCLRLCSKWEKQKRCSQIFREVFGVFQRNFNCSKNSAVLEPRTRQFSRTWGFEAKAKDFKMCPRGQGRPRELHLCDQRLKITWYINFFHNCEAALVSHTCFPIRLEFHQHLNSHITFFGNPTEPSNHTREQFLHLPSYLLIRLYSDQSMTTRSPYREFSKVSHWHSTKRNRIALASLSIDTIYDITLAIYYNRTLYAYFRIVCNHQAYITV